MATGRHHVPERRDRGDLLHGLENGNSFRGGEAPEKHRPFRELFDFRSVGEGAVKEVVHFKLATAHFASWKMIPIVCRRPEWIRLTP
jgi:hypothetical protein